MDLTMGKKGIIFTLISLLLSGLFIILYTTDVRTPLDTKSDLYSMKVTNIRIYTDNLEEYLSYDLSVAGKEAMETTIFNAQKEWMAYNTSLQLQCTFADALLDGKITKRNAEIIYADGDANAGTPNTPVYLYGTIQTEGVTPYNNNDPIGTAALIEPGNPLNNRTSGFLIKFNTTSTKYGQLNHSYFAITTFTNPVNVTVKIYAADCNESLYLLDTATLSITANHPQTAFFFNFSQHAYLSPNTPYYAYITGNDYFAVFINDFAGGDGTYTPVYNQTSWTNFTDVRLTNKSSINIFMDKVFNMSRDNLSIYGNATVYNITITQDDPWTVNVTANILLRVTDNFSTYDKMIRPSAIFGIDNLPEPLYLYTLNKTRPIKKAPFGVEGGFNITILTNFTQANMTWEQRVNAPSFLQRMLNLTNATGANGIETLLLNAIVRNLTTVNTSFVDWIYFNQTNFTCDNLIILNDSKMRELFFQDAANPPLLIGDYWAQNNGTKIDIENLVRYNITSDLWNSSCPP